MYIYIFLYEHIYNVWVVHILFIILYTSYITIIYFLLTLFLLPFHTSSHLFIFHIYTDLFIQSLPNSYIHKPPSPSSYSPNILHNYITHYSIFTFHHPHLHPTLHPHHVPNPHPTQSSSSTPPHLLSPTHPPIPTPTPHYRDMWTQRNRFLNSVLTRRNQFLNLSSNFIALIQDF